MESDLLFPITIQITEINVWGNILGCGKTQSYPFPPHSVMEITLVLFNPEGIDF